MSLTGVNRRPLPSWRAIGRAVYELLLEPHWVDESGLRLFAATLLTAGGVFFFRREALIPLLAATGTALGLLGGLWVAFHVLGMRSVDLVWPGLTRAMTTALMVFCIMPPGIPALLVIALTLLAILVEGGMRQSALPLALGGVLLVWPLAWAWQTHFGLSYVSPFDLRHLDDPIRLWSRFQVSVDPVRLYMGNVAGMLGATSFGLAAMAVLVLTYARKGSWIYLGGFTLPILLFAVISRGPLTVYLISGPALVFAGILAADMRRLPRNQVWRVAAGLGGGVVTALLLSRGVGVEAYGAGVLAAATGLSVLQLFGPAGARATAADSVARAQPGERLALGGRLIAQLAALLMVQPVGLVLVARDEELETSRRVLVVATGAVCFVAAAAVALYWLWVARLPG